MAIEVTPPSPALPTKPTSSQEAPMFSLRIVNLEYYSSPPLPGMDVCYSKFQGRSITEVPVVRIYGSTPTGQKACLHLHQVFPYFYVPYDDDLPQDTSDALAYVRCLASAIEKAMKLASSNAAKKQHVHSCSLVRARRYYGYYPSEQLFIKVVLYHPQEITRISTLLLSGGIMNRKFQPHESHVSYLLQLLIDQNLAGMSFIHLSRVKFRRPVPDRPSDTTHVVQQLRAEFTRGNGDAKPQTKEPCSMETTPSAGKWEGKSQTHLWVESSIPPHWVWPLHHSSGGTFGRHSTCELEVDATVEDILNRRELMFVPLHEAGPAVKLVQSLTPMWEEERLRTGEAGPAGAAAALRPSPDRSPPPPSPLEQALRDSLLQIVQDEERFDQVLKSTQDALREYSQAANGVRSEVEQQESEPKPDANNAQEDDGGEESRRSEEELVNEHVIRTQLTPPGRASQEVEDEVAELLEWMGASQEHGMGASDDDVDEEALEVRRAFSQSWDSPTMEAAMLQALSKFEQATQKECQEILDCVNDCDEDGGEEDLEAALLEIDLEDVRIPQNDGADDEEGDFAAEPKRIRSSKRDRKEKDVPKRPMWGLLPLVGGSSQPANLKHETPEPRVSKREAARPRNEGNLRPRKVVGGLSVDEKPNQSDVSLRALMRRKRERRKGRGGSSIIESQSEGEHGVVKTESSLSESQEQQIIALSGLARGEDEEEVEAMVQDVGRGALVQQSSIHPEEDLVDEPESRRKVQRVDMPLKVEDLTMKRDHNLREAGDHRDCGGGKAPYSETGGSMSIQVQYQAPAEEGLLGESLKSTQLKEAKDLSHSPASDEIEDQLDMDEEVPIAFKLVDIARSSWAEVVKEITSSTSHNIQLLSSDVHISQDIGAAAAHSDLKDVAYLAEGLPSEALSLGSDEDGTHVIETQLVEHEILWRLKQDKVTEAGEEEFIGTILVKEREDFVEDLKVDRSPHESPPEPLVNSKEGSEVGGLLFTDMSDVSEDSFDWGDELGSSHRREDSEEGAYVSEEDVKPELLTDRNGRETEAVFDSGQAAEDETTIPVKFHQRPPSREDLMSTLGQHNLREVDYGGVFYGNSKDVPGRATVSAGLLFDVKSRETLDLPPFLFGAENKRSIFRDANVVEFRSGMGVPCHYENDGSVSYLLTPARPPPSRVAVQRWLSENHASGGQKHSSARGERVFTMDANTGKLVPIDEAGSSRSTQESLPVRHSGEEDVEYFRPASPKYDEKHVLASPMLSNLPASPAYARSSKRRSSGAAAQEPPGSKTLFPNPSSETTTSANTQTSSDDAPHVPKPELPHSIFREKKNVDCIPPTKDEVKREVPAEGEASKPASRWRDVSQITGPSPLKGQLTPLSQSGFRDPASEGAGQQITLMSIEVHSETRGSLRPDPRYDAVGMVVVDVQYDDRTRGHLNNQTLVLLVDAKASSSSSASSKNIDGVAGCVIIYLADELVLLKCFVRLVRLCDPDMLVGWEVQGASLGLLAERAANLGFGLLKELSRTPPKVQPNSSDPDAKSEEDHPRVQELRNSVFGDMVPEVQESVITDEWGRTHGSGLIVGGRIVLNLWRIMRGEVKLGIYTLEAVAEAVLRRRVPRIPCRTLTRWFAQARHRCIEYFIDRARLNFQIMDQLDLLNRTAELARVFGIDFYSVFSRGSQYRVESMMLRLAHTQNFLLLSPSRQQVAAQPAMECLPLVMEPESRFYTSPVVVLDFQSLYPSMIIAYNLCFSTCLGKIVSANPKVLGVTNLPVPPGLLQELQDLLTITPNGVMFTPPEVRQGVVPRLLSEILSTRIMVKQAMKKLPPEQRVLQRVLNARQFALKLIANVTYGYTAAGFSGRMPCAELADSIVQSGRLTLERAIHLVNTTKRWDARVVYGDTDSMFVHLEGRTREEAFRIGQEIAAAVTTMNPNPVTLKMEKVYHPCVLLTKKRYVGYSYESPGQATPTFDAKGIETIRRDTCAAVAKTLERSLRTLFETQDLSQVKAYLQRQWGKIVSGRVSLRDFVFAKEVRLGTYSARAAVLPAAAIVASKAMALDPRAEPRYAERVPYVVVHGEPGARLSDVVVDPHTMLANGLRLHDTYYITKQIIPALQRIFGLVGADLKLWYAELPRVYRPPASKRPGKVTLKSGDGSKGATIDQYYLSQHCSVCGELMRGSQLVCSSCSAHPQAVASVLTSQTAQLEMEFKHLEAICRHCGGGDGRPEGHIACVSLDCSIFFERLKVQKELQALSTVSANCGYYPPCFLDFRSELF